MKQEPYIRYFIIFCLLFTISGFGSAFTQTETTSNESVLDNLTSPITVPNVTTIINNPSQYQGKSIILNGIVTKTYPSQHQLTVADTIGCSLCTTKNTQNSIPVWYQGKIPAVRETVQISGQVIQVEKLGYIINASTVKV